MINNTVRRSQLVSPWGVGAIVPFPDDESLMIAGLDMWRFGDNYRCPEEFLVKDDRLVKRLGVSELRLPPDYREPGKGYRYANITIPAVRFPRWHYCPFCGTMSKLSYFGTNEKCSGYEWPRGRSCKNRKYRPRLIPERFIVICEDGHIDDLPIAEWIHENHTIKYNENTCKIRRTTGGVSASLAGVRYECSCGASRSLTGATREGALDNVYRCVGAKPWLGVEKDEQNLCGKSVKVVQRGGTNVWYPIIKSSIYIPVDIQDVDNHILDVLERRWSKISSAVDENGMIDKSRTDIIAEIEDVDAELLYKAACAKLNADGDAEINEDISEEEYRLSEYKALLKNSGQDNLKFYCKNYSISKYNNALLPFFKSISLVYKLCETRAFVGFSRLLPDNTKSIREQKAMLSTKSVHWLPAVQVFGEGIFFEFDEERLRLWAAQDVVKNQVAKLSQSYNQMSSRYGKPSIQMNAKYALIHTFAHLLINQLSFDCGYGSSSIRERIYCDLGPEEHNMYGVLLYTASGDSEGSMGGLVRMGKAGNIEDVIMDAIENARWCSADPICIQSEGQGPDSCNLAACHNCALLPETCCENGNRILDRALVIGKSDQKNLGYFNL